MRTRNFLEIHSELHLPDDRSYTQDHEWAMAEGSTIKVGISNYAQGQLGDIVFVEMPNIDDEFERGDEFGTLESVKAVSELYILPISGRIVAINEDLSDEPGLLNQEPYGNWIIEVEPADLGEMAELLSSSAYLDILDE